MKEMTVQQWLEKIYVDEFSGTMIFSTPHKENPKAIEHVLDIRGWGSLSSEMGHEEAIKFQDKVAVFVVEAIKEKLERETTDNK